MLKMLKDNNMKRKNKFFLTTMAAIALGISSCQANTNNTANAPSTNTPATDGSTEPLNVRISGAGASFPAPLYQRWFQEYNQDNPGVQVSYQSVGSGAGVQQYLQRTVDFGASDAPLTEEERQKFQTQYGTAPVQLPMTAGSVVFAYNLPGVNDLKLSREAYCGIATGEITNWSDPVIAKANPNVQLPDRKIAWVHRADGSGTTFIFTNHIDEACPNWQGGTGKTVSWPVGLGAKGNEGIAAQVQQTEGAIGYVEYAYAIENNISAASIENKSGNIIEPTPESASLVFADEEIPQDFGLTVADPANPDAYPIAGLTWLLIYPEYKNPDTAQALENVITWALNNGDEIAKELGYIPLPEDVKQRVQETLTQELGNTTSNPSP
jgi:phosphate transport system substrate-binding protein